jgi:hypothetical protein
MRRVLVPSAYNYIYLTIVYSHVRIVTNGLRPFHIPEVSQTFMAAPQELSSGSCMCFEFQHSYTSGITKFHEQQICFPCKIWGFRYGDYEEWCLLGCYAVWLFLRSVRRLLVTAGDVPSSPILVTLMTEALRASETSSLTRATRRNIPEDAILQCVHIVTSVLSRRSGDERWSSLTQ